MGHSRIPLAVLLVAGVLCGLRSGECTAAEKAQSVDRGYSGMVRLTDAATGAKYLVVHDRKDMPSHEKYAWLGILSWAPDQGTSWKPLPVSVPEGEDPPNDLEACCLVPGPVERFLVAESSYYQRPGRKPQYGRIILFALLRDDASPAGRRVRWERSFRPFRAPEDLRDRARHIEGMGCVATPEGGLALVLCSMGSDKASSRLTWGALDLAAKRPFERRGHAVLTPGSGPLGERSCSALFLKSVGRGARHHVWSAAALDLGDRDPRVPTADAGPFRSQVYWAGTLVRVPGRALFRYCMRATPRPLWTLDGIKIEALARPPSAIPTAGLAFATDDEDHGGIWRVLRRNSNLLQSRRRSASGRCPHVK